MTNFRVNISFEEELVTGKRETSLNHHFEFLFMLLSNDTLATNHQYQRNYLDAIEKLKNAKVSLSPLKDLDKNWWGEINDRVKKIATKTFAYEFLAERNILPLDVKIIKNKAEFDHTIIRENQIVKIPLSSSGRGIFKANQLKMDAISYPLIIENLRDRRRDFSCYYFSDHKKIIFYENMVDQRFAYKGSKYLNLPLCDFSSLALSPEEFEVMKDWPQLISELAQKIGDIDFCVDAYTYEENGLKFFPISEINPRRTMGRCGYELSLRYLENPKNAEFLFLKKNEQSEGLILSPEEARFKVVLKTISMT